MRVLFKVHVSLTHLGRSCDLLIGRSLQNNHIETNIGVQKLFPELAQEKGVHTLLSCMKT